MIRMVKNVVEKSCRPLKIQSQPKLLYSFIIVEEKEIPHELNLKLEHITQHTRLLTKSQMLNLHNQE